MSTPNHNNIDREREHLGSIATITKGMKWHVFTAPIGKGGRWRPLKTSTGYVDAFTTSNQCDRDNIVICSKLSQADITKLLNPQSMQPRPKPNTPHQRKAA